MILSAFGSPVPRQFTKARQAKTAVIAVLFAATGCSRDGSGPPIETNMVFIRPQFEELAGGRVRPYFGVDENDWQIQSPRECPYRPPCAAPGDVVLLKVASTVHEEHSQQLTVPTVERSETGELWYHPVITLKRVAPTAFQGYWTANADGAELTVEFFESSGLGDMNLSTLSLYMLACLPSFYANPAPERFDKECIVHQLNSSGWSHAWSASDTVGWAKATCGNGEGWPGSPPPGYALVDGSRRWQTSLTFTLEDTLYWGRGYCTGAVALSERQVIECNSDVVRRAR